MPDETKMIEATAGPYAGQRLTVSKADADEAIADGWARDPFAPPSDKPAKELTGEEHQAMIAKAEKSARKIRGEDKAMEAHGPGHGYQTRDVDEAATKPAAQAAPAPKKR